MTRHGMSAQRVAAMAAARAAVRTTIDPSAMHVWTLEHDEW